MDYHDYIRTHVTGPAGMINTDCYNNDRPVPNLASGYFWNDDEDSIRTSNIFVHSARGSAAGGGYSTVEDLNRFANALMDGTLLPMDLVDTLTTVKIERGPGGGYAFLFGDSRENGHRYVGHGGGAPGINADLKIFTDLGFTITAMGNYDEGASAVTHYALDLIVHGRDAK
jgi:CubicO group peptidase (beta-lactamase class C family)